MTSTEYGPRLADGGDDAAIGELVRRMEDGWNRGDGHAYAGPFADDADFISVGGLRASGRETIARGHDEIFATVFAGTTIAMKTCSIRYLTPDVAVVDVAATLTHPQWPGQQSCPFLVTMRSGDGWQIVALHNMVPLERPAAGPVEERLAADRPSVDQRNNDQEDR